MDQEKKKAFYASLAIKLNDHHEFPAVYLFKFIVPSDNKKVAQVDALFGEEAEVVMRQSSKGTYVSISAKELMISAESIIERYRKAEGIEGLIAL